MKFIDIVVKLGGCQAATPKKIKEHMKDDDITILELQSHLQAFRRTTKTIDNFVNTKQQPTLVDTEDWTSKMAFRQKTTTVDNFVRTKQQPTFVDTKDWTQQMVYYFKERDEKTDDKKRKITDNVIGDESKATKKKKYTTWSIETCKKFIDIVVKHGGSKDATPNRIKQQMKDDNVTLFEVQNHFKVRSEEIHESETSTPPEYKGISKVYIDIGDKIQTCHACKSKLWTRETNQKQITKRSSFAMCCKKGQVQLPKMEDPPKDLLDLFTTNDATSKYFIHNIRKFNSIFSFTSIGGKVDKTVNNGRGPWIYRMQGENYHLMPSLGPKDNDIPKFSQLYIFDNQNEIQNRFTALSSSSKKPTTKAGNSDASKIGNPIVLPSTYTGGTRYKMQNYLDAVALCKAFGYPDLFITFTSNTRFTRKHILGVINADGDTLKAMVEAIYPTIDEEIGKDGYFENKAILVRTNEEVDLINEHMLSQINEKEKVYLSSDTICQTEINGTNIGKHTYIPRLQLMPSDKRVPFKFNRRQFPLMNLQMQNKRDMQKKNGYNKNIIIIGEDSEDKKVIEDTTIT
nr:hypothetical protein [Tanacetum cinerariifolium]